MTGDWVVFTSLVWVPAVVLALVVLAGWLWGPTVGDLVEPGLTSSSSASTVTSASTPPTTAARQAPSKGGA